MLNNKGERELAYIVKVLETKELEGYDNVHYIRVLEWWCVAPKDIKLGDLVVYFEIDSKLPANDGEHIKIFHASVWIEALLKNPYSGDVYWGFIRHATYSDTHQGGVNAKINKYINSEIEKYPSVKQRAHICKWLETASTVIFNENAEPYNDMKI